jgi:hypothetical protein
MEKYTNNGAQNVLKNHYKEFSTKVDRAAKDILESLYHDVLSEVKGLKGAISLIKRVTGKDIKLSFEDDSEMDLLMRDKFKETGIQDKLDKLAELYEDASINLDTSCGYDDAKNIITRFDNRANALLSGGITPVV